MKKTLSMIAIAVVLSACSSAPKHGNETTGNLSPINTQKLSTNFKRKGIKIEWECAWGTGMFGMTDAMCSKGDVKSIEVTAYAASYGNSEVVRENAFKVGEMKAKAKLRHFLHEDVYSSNTQSMVAKNVEKANDVIKSKITMDKVEVSDDERTNADKDANFATRQNVNDTVQTLTTSIRTQAQGILQGVYVKEEDIVDRQTVKVTIRWDKDSESAAKFFRNKFR